MPRVTRTWNDPKTRWAGQRFVALSAAAVVLLIIFAFIGISQASHLGAAGPQLPPAKATLLAQDSATMAAARAKNAGHPKQLYPTPAAEPTETITSGIIYYAGQTKIPNFLVQDMYRGPVNGTWEFVYVGSDTSTSAAGVGAVRVETYSNAKGNQLVGVFDAPDDSTYIGITGISGNVLRIKSDKTASFGFDLTTNTFTS